MSVNYQERLNLGASPTYHFDGSRGGLVLPNGVRHAAGSVPGRAGSSNGPGGGDQDRRINPLQREQDWLASPERQEISTGIMTVLYGLDDALKRESEAHPDYLRGGSFIDFRLVPDNLLPKDIPKISILSGLKDVNRLQLRIPVDSGNEADFLRAKLDATSAYFGQIIHRLAGHSTGRFEETYRRTMGDKAEPASMDFIDQVVYQLAEELTLITGEHHADRKKFWSQLSEYKKKAAIISDGQVDSTRVINSMSIEAEKDKARLRELGLYVPEPDFDIIVQAVNKYWKFWVDGGYNTEGILKFLVQLNKHEMHLQEWIKGAPERYAAHEIAFHLVQMYRWALAIKEGKLNPVMGITTIPGPEQFVNEGIAQTIQNYGEFDWTSETIISCLDNYLHALAWQTAYYDYAVLNMSSDKAADEYRRIYPLANRNQIREELEDVRRNPGLGLYKFQYGNSARFCLLTAAALDSKGKALLLEEVYKSPMTLDQFRTKSEILIRQHPAVAS